MRKSFKLSHLTAAAALLVGVFAGSQMGSLAAPPAANAAGEPPDSLSPFNSGEQRRQMILQLTEMNQRLTRIEAKLNSGLSVKVTEMPAVTVKNPEGK